MIDRFWYRTRMPVTAAGVLGAGLVLVTAAMATWPRSGKYVGTSSETSAAPVTFTVSVGGKKITSFVGALAYNGKCGEGGGPSFGLNVPSMTITSGGHFSATTQGVDNATKGLIRITGIVSNRSAYGSIVEPKPFFTCSAPHQKVNPYSETFTASTK
jgi:hypothetical protein